MLYRMTKATLALAVMTALSMGASSVSAQPHQQHQSYKYTGECFNYQGESQMIKALELLELAYWEQNPAIRADLAQTARLELQQARPFLKSGASQQYVHLADTYLHYFATICSPLYLDRASAHIHRALEYEALACQPPKPPVCPGNGGPVGPGKGGPGGPGAGPGGPGGPGQGPGHAGGGFRISTKRGSFGVSQGGLHIGGKRGGIRIKW